jgi:hypothetical protein
MLGFLFSLRLLSNIARDHETGKSEMSELAHGAMLVGALGGAACVLGGRRTVLDLVASTAMLGAMADMALTRIVAPLGWTAVLASLGIALGMRLRPARSGADAALSPSRRRHALHRALAFVVGAWAFASPDGGSAAAPSEAGHVHGEPGVGLVFVTATLAMTAFGGWLVAVELKDRPRPQPGGSDRGSTGWARHAAEAASTTVMLAAMAVPGVLAALA